MKGDVGQVHRRRSVWLARHMRGDVGQVWCSVVWCAAWSGVEKKEEEEEEKEEEKEEEEEEEEEKDHHK